MDMKKIVEKIISYNSQLRKFWSNSYGWAPDEAADLMSKSRLDRQVLLSECLKLWFDSDSIDDGKLILAWTNLGCLVEGNLKLFLSVYFSDYKEDIHAIKNRKGKLIEPDSLALEKLKLFFKNKNILSKKWIDFISVVQKRRNAIHAFKDRDIGDFEELKKYVELYNEFIRDFNLPYPDDIYEPR
jgi:hypothetical protein